MTTGAATVVVGDLHLTLTCIAAGLELDPCLPNRNSVVPFVSLFGSKATETLCVWWSFHASGSGWGSEVVTDILTPRFS